MLKKLSRGAVGLVALLSFAVFGFVSPASASTQTVRFQAGSWRCSNGLYGISHVTVTGTASAPYANAEWAGPANTQTANVAITGIPAGGGSVHVVVTYHCKVYWWAGPGEPAAGDRWIYGSGYQPLNIL